MNPPCKMTEDVGVTGYKAPEVSACDKEGNPELGSDQKSRPVCPVLIS